MALAKQKETGTKTTDTKNTKNNYSANNNPRSAYTSTVKTNTPKTNYQTQRQQQQSTGTAPKINTKTTTIKTNSRVNNVSPTKTGNPTSSSTSNKQKFTDKVENFLQKNFTTKGVESQPDSKYKQFSQKLDSNFKDDGTIGSSFFTPDSKAKEIGSRADKRISTEKLLSGQESKNYTMSEDERNSFGAVIDKRTGQKADENYVNALYTGIGEKNDSLTKAYQDLNTSYENGLIDANEYTKQYQALEKEREAHNKNIEEANNFSYLGGMDYYNWLKENGTQDEIESFEDYVSSYDDSMLESLSNSYKATMVDWANSYIEPIEMISALASGDESYLQSDERLSTQLRNVSQELQSYTLNGKNDQGLRRYSLQTVSSLMPMINDAIIGTITGGAFGLTGEGLNKFVSTYTNIQMGLGSAGQTMRQRLEEGNRVDTAFANGVIHGTITALVEALNVGNVTNVVGLLTGTAGQSALGVGLLSLPKFANMALEAFQSGTGEAVEEWAEVFADYYADWIQNALFGTEVKVGDSPWKLDTYGGIGDGGLTDQMIMAGLGAVLMGVPANVATTIDSVSKYKAGGEAIKYYEALKKQAEGINDAESVQKSQAIIDFLNRERQTYLDKSALKGAVETTTDQVNNAPSVDDVLNVTANAFKLDVDDQIDGYNRMKAEAENMRTTLQDALDRRGYGDMIDLDTYVKASPEVRESSKAIMDFANKLGVDLRITDNYVTYENGAFKGNKLGEMDNGVAVNNNTVIVNPFAVDFEFDGAKAMISTFAHEITHTTEKTGQYKELETAVREAMGNKWNEEYEAVKKRYGKKVKNDTEINKEIVARYIENNLGNEKFLQRLSNYNNSLFAKIFSNMEALLSADPNSQVANNFFKAYNERIDNAMKSPNYTNVYGDMISSTDAQFNLATYKTKGRKILANYIDKQVEKGVLTREDGNNIVETLDWYAEKMEEFTKENEGSHFSNWQNFDMTIDHKGFPQLTCVVANGEYKMNIDFSTVCKKRKSADALFNQLAKEGLLDDRALTQEEIAKIRDIVKRNGLEVACSLCFVDSKRFNQGGWADTLINGKEDKIDKDLVALGVQDPNTKHIMGWNEFVDRIANNQSDIGTFNFAGREDVTEGTLHTLDNSQLNKKGMAWLRKVVNGTSNKSEVGKIARALLNHPELRKHLLLGDLYASEAFGNIKRGMTGNKGADTALFKIVNQHQGVAKPKSPYIEVTYNNEIIESRDKTFKSDVAREVGGVRIQSFSDFMTNMVFDYMECVAELQTKGLTAHSYTKVKEFAELFGNTGIKINLSIIPKATVLSSKEFHSLSEAEQEEVKRFAGLEVFSNEQIDSLSNEEFEQLKNERGLSQNKDGVWTAYIFEDESFNWLDALELQSREGYDKNVGTICVGVSDEHIWKMLNDDNVKQIIPYHKSSLNHVVATMMNIGAYTDYTDFQNTRVWNGEKWTSINGAEHKGKKDFSFYADPRGMIANGYDAKATSTAYIEWCAEKGYLPKFDQFAFVEDSKGNWVRNKDGSYTKVEDGKGNLSINENYYKVLIDFRAYDKNGDIAPQQNVTQTYPENFFDVLKQSFLSYEENLSRQDQAIPKMVQEVVDEINDSRVQHSAGGELAMRRMLESDNPEVRKKGELLQQKLKEAQDMDDQKIDMGTIWKEKGWIKKEDGKWRFQFYDGAEETLSKIMDLAETINGKKTLGALESKYITDFIGEDNILFKMYPDLKDIYISFYASDDDSDGFFDKGENDGVVRVLPSININMQEFRHALPDGGFEFKLSEKEAYTMADTFFHELQHAIQNQEEGFERGSNLTIAEEERRRKNKEAVDNRISEIENQLIGTQGINDDYDVIDAYYDFKQTGGKNGSFAKTLTPEQVSLLDEYARLHKNYDELVDVSDIESWAEYFTNVGEREAREEARRAINPDERKARPEFEKGTLLSERAKKKMERSSKESSNELAVSDDGGDVVPPKKVEVDVTDGYSDRKKQQFRESNLEKSTVLDEKQKEKTRQMSAEGMFTYQSYINDVEVNRAREYMERDGIDKTFNDYMASNDISMKTVVKGEVLLQQLAKDNDPRWEEVAIKLADDSTIAGQALQAYAILQRLMPEGQLTAIQRNMRRMQDNLDRKYGRRAPHLEITPELETELLKAETAEEAQKVRDKIMDNLIKQQPITFSDMIDSWRYLAMLGNPRTHVRNILGNAVFMPAIGLKNAIGTALETAMQDKLKYKTKAIVSRIADKELYQAGQRAYDNHKAMVEKTQKYEQKGFREKTWLGKFLNKADKANTWLLDNEDYLFSKDRYALSYAQFLKANGLTPETLTEDMDIRANQYALVESLKATYRDANAIADWLNELERSEKGGLKMLSYAKKAVLPFTKTPFNIVKRGFEYSGLGLLKSIVDGATAVQNGTMDMNTWIDEMSAGLSGSALMALGYLLAQMGIFRTKDDDKDRKKYFDQENGEQDYAIDLGKGTYTVDWMSPVIMPLAMGAEFGKVFDELGNVDGAETALNAFLNISANLFDPVVETSMLSSLQDAMSSYSNEGGKYFGDVVASGIASYIGQMFPTLGGQVARIIDDTRRTTSPNTGLIDKTKKQILNKIPFLSKKNQPYINKQGQEEKTEDLGMDWFGRAILNTLSPGYYSSKDIDKYDDEMLRLYEDTGEIDVLPSSTAKSVTFEKENMKFSDEEYTQWHKTRYSTESKYVNQFMDSNAYKQLTDEERVATIKDIRKYAQEVAKKEFLESRGKEYESKNLTNANNAVDNGIELYAYYDYLNNAGSKQAEKVKYLEDSGLTDKQKQYLYGQEGYKTSYEDVYKKVFGGESSSSKSKKKSGSSKKSNSTSKKKKTSSSGVSGGSLPKKGAVRNNLVAPSQNTVRPKLPSNYLKAYSNSLNSRKDVSTASRNTTVCPNCGNRVPSGASRCPVCGRQL